MTDSKHLYGDYKDYRSFGYPRRQAFWLAFWDLPILRRF